MTVEDLVKDLEELTGVPAKVERKKSREEKRAEKERLREFTSLPVPLQEAVLKYARQLRRAYRVEPPLSKA